MAKHENVRKKFQWVLIGTGILLQLGAGLFALANQQWCVACQSFGMMAVWYAAWHRIVSIDCQLGVTIDALKEVNGSIDIGQLPDGIESECADSSECEDEESYK